MVDWHLVPWSWFVEKAKRKPRVFLEAVPLVEFLIRREKKEEIHNSLLQQAIQETDAPSLFWGSGADPPTIRQPFRQ